MFDPRVSLYSGQKIERRDSDVSFFIILTFITFIASSYVGARVAVAAGFAKLDVVVAVLCARVIWEVHIDSDVIGGVFIVPASVVPINVGVEAM